MAIHLRMRNTPAIQYRTACGLYVALMHIGEKFTENELAIVTCPTCRVVADAEAKAKQAALFDDRDGEGGA